MDAFASTFGTIFSHLQTGVVCQGVDAFVGQALGEVVALGLRFSGCSIVWRRIRARNFAPIAPV
jgi:hypothetical protein